MGMLVLALAAMPAMHEKVQKRTGKQQQEGQRAEQVSPMFGQQEKRRDGEKGQYDQVDLASDRVPMRNRIWAFHGVSFARRDQARAYW